MAISQGGSGQGKIFTEINITPLTDIFLVLLIIMMVIAPTFQKSDKSIKVPGIKAGEAVEQNPVTVEVTKQGTFFLNGKPAQADSLTSQLQPLLSASKDKSLVLRADTATKSSEVMKVFEAASTAGFAKLTIAGEPLNAQRQQALEQQAEKEGKPNPNPPAPTPAVEAPQ